MRSRVITRQAGLILAVAMAMLLLLPGAALAQPELPSPSGWPLEGEPEVLRGFDPPAEKWGAGHRGVDLAAQVGDRVLAGAGGEVTYAGMLAGRGVVVVDHGQVRTTYEPVTAGVSVGTTVGAGDVIGVLQAGDHCSQACLHWGLLEGETYLDPLLLSGSTEVRLLAGTEREAAEQRAKEREAEAKEAEAQAAQNAQNLVSGTPGQHGFVMPVQGPMTSGYGQRFHPVLKVWKLHDGTDFGAPCGAPIRAPYAGTVKEAYYNGGYGNRLMIDHGVVDGSPVTTGYNHATSYVVGTGAKVEQGQLIGYVGTTGYSTGCHLHLMTWIGGQLVNPMSWF